ncbi:MAG: hypothetical protein EMLJLAPB_00951 [Candidatus Argoarchaeum ethanivorans]|uniref:HEPN domain-containing protein n=1 Tax=Candidatus Argoarchaeum ethanivorans TaxID=2608793 RepID=A0A811TGC6_9EURY|nr:MAG: hypothetical protein EMLJLAPB_00951 [Candidatus Argoarchaeum ethanivorans]
MIQETLEEIKIRKELASYYFSNFEKHRLQDPAKASEFLWGTLNALVYAIGLLHGKKIAEHSKVIGILKELRMDEESISAAQMVHANFFHDFMDKETFELQTKKVVTMLRKLEEILEKELKRQIKSIKHERQVCQ